MELIDQHTKKIMEGCKKRAKDAGLTFSDESLEYIVTNKDLIELSPKIMIPTLYDYWVHDVEVLKEKGKYELYPGNPYETVINTRPPISFYNDNNPDWLNVMIFYHVIGHIDFFQNNLFFEHTWEDDFAGRALSDKRLVAKLRSEKGRWVDYIIEFARGLDNLCGYYKTLSDIDKQNAAGKSPLDYYFDVFIQDVLNKPVGEYIKEIERYNGIQTSGIASADDEFMMDVYRIYPEFNAMYKKFVEDGGKKQMDVLEFLLKHSPFLNKEENRWMKSVVQVIRNTSITFQPQIRTKIMNEGWASYWHETLFLNDDRIKGHEVDFARINAGVTAMPRVGLNPYALGMRLFYHIEDGADKGRYSDEYDRMENIAERKKFDAKLGEGRKTIFDIRKNLNDFLFIKNYVDQDFVTKNDLFVAGRRLNRERMVWEYYVKSKNAGDYREMLYDSLYHPPHITIDETKMDKNILYLNHTFEEKPLVAEYIPNTLIGLEYLWGGPVQLETSEVAPNNNRPPRQLMEKDGEKPLIVWKRVVYTSDERKVYKRNL